MKPVSGLTATALLTYILTAAHAAEPAGNTAKGRQLFTSGATPACALCHTLQDAKAEGAIGPVLDELKPDAQRVLKAIRNGIGQMPAYSKEALSDADAMAIAQYVAVASGGAK